MLSSRILKCYQILKKYNKRKFKDIKTLTPYYSKIKLQEFSSLTLFLKRTTPVENQKNDPKKHHTEVVGTR